MLALILIVVFLVILFLWRNNQRAAKRAKISELMDSSILKIAELSGFQPDQRPLRRKDVAIILKIRLPFAKNLFRKMTKLHWIYPEKNHVPIGGVFRLSIVGLERAKELAKANGPAFTVDEGARF